MQIDFVAYVETVGDAVGLTLDADAKKRVAAQLEIAAAMAAQIMDFPLPPEVEAATVFTP